MRMVLDDLHTIWEHALVHELGLTPSPGKREFSQYVAVLIVADHFDRREVREMLNMLVREMGFAGVMVLQVIPPTLPLSASSQCGKLAHSVTITALLLRTTSTGVGVHVLRIWASIGVCCGHW
jgi:hypothetical protein